MLLLQEYPDQYCLYSNFWGTSLKLTYELEAISSRRYVGGITHPVAKRYIVSIFALFLHFHFSLKNFCVAAITLEGGEPRPSSWLARASATLTTCCAVGKCHPACGSVCVCRESDYCVCNVEVDQSRQKSACSTSSPPAYLTQHYCYTWLHWNRCWPLGWGGECGWRHHGTVSEYYIIFHTQELVTCHVYAEVDPSKKKLRRGDAS